MDNIIHLNPGITPPLIPNHGLHLIMDDKKHTLVLNMILGTLTRRNIHDVKIHHLQKSTQQKPSWADHTMVWTSIDT